jgi:endonuclease/exonuclease/phosphatase family metal-dependent hydrolase
MRWLWLVALLGCGDTGDRRSLPAVPAGDATRVMSFNVNFGIAGDPSTIDAITSARPDIVLLQETNPTWAAAMIERLEYRYRTFADPVGWPASGMGILSRYPIVSVDKLAAPDAPFFAWRIVLDTPKLGRIQLLDVHLRPPMSDGGSWVVGFFSTRSDRLREVEYHAAALDPKLPTIIAGDFNEEQGNGQALAYLVDHGYTDAVAQHVGKQRTWEWPLSTGGSMMVRFQLDHILYDDHFVALASSVVEAGRSDHKPVVADFVRVDP